MGGDFGDFDLFSSLQYTDFDFTSAFGNFHDNDMTANEQLFRPDRTALNWYADAHETCPYNSRLPDSTTIDTHGTTISESEITDRNEDFCFTTPTTSSASVGSSPKKRSAAEVITRTPESSSSALHSGAGERITKRHRNTEAARRYRQRNVDRVTELEQALEAMTKDRDELRLKLARSEAQADVLKGMVGGRDR